MNINGLAKAILELNLHPDFPIIVETKEGKQFQVIAYFIDAKKLHLCVADVAEGQEET